MIREGKVKGKDPDAQKRASDRDLLLGAGKIKHKLTRKLLINYLKPSTLNGTTLTLISVKS